MYAEMGSVGMNTGTPRVGSAAPKHPTSEPTLTTLHQWTYPTPGCSIPEWDAHEDDEHLLAELAPLAASARADTMWDSRT